MKSYEHIAGNSLTHQTDGRDILIVKDWEEHFFSDKDVMMGKISRHIEFACKGRHIRVRERIRSH